MASEENDCVAQMSGDQVEWNSFRQVDYLWLFDPELRFSERKGFKLDDSAINACDYNLMR